MSGVISMALWIGGYALGACTLLTLAAVIDRARGVK